MLVDGLHFLDTITGPIGNKHKAGRLYEYHMLNFIKELHIDGDCVDVGCFIGTHTVFFAKKLNKKVYAFDKVNHVEFHQHIKLNNIANYKKYPFFLLPPLRLIDLVNTRIGLIKIDVDGSDEIDVLESCKEIIDRDHPHIFIEARTREKRGQIDQFLKDYKRLNVFNATPTYYYN